MKTFKVISGMALGWITALSGGASAQTNITAANIYSASHVTVMADALYLWQAPSTANEVFAAARAVIPEIKIGKDYKPLVSNSKDPLERLMTIGSNYEIMGNTVIFGSQIMVEALTRHLASRSEDQRLQLQGVKIAAALSMINEKAGVDRLAGTKFLRLQLKSPYTNVRFFAAQSLVHMESVTDSSLFACTGCKTPDGKEVVAAEYYFDRLNEETDPATAIELYKLTELRKASPIAITTWRTLHGIRYNLRYCNAMLSQAVIGLP